MDPDADPMIAPQKSTTRLKPVVAVLLSTYNGAAYLAAQLDSLAAQEGVDVRLHVRDDGSSDGTPDVLRNYADRWPNLAAVQARANLGTAGSFLELLRTAPEDGVDFYAFCDQDDVWLPHKLARAAEALAHQEGPSIYCSNLACVSDDLRPLGVPPPNGDTRLEHLLFENIAIGCTVVMNPAARALVNSRPPERGVVMHDWWCALVVAAHGGRITYDPEPSLLYRQHGENSVGVDARIIAQNIKQALRFLRAPQSFYPIHTQATELLRLHGDAMVQERSAAVEGLIASKRSLMARARFAFSGQVVRRRSLDRLVVRGLVVAGLY